MGLFVCKFILVFILVELFQGFRASPHGPRLDACGYQSCPRGKEGFVNVHLVPHTHDDVGWLKTVDQYYYGANNDIYKAGVQYIIDSVIDELKNHSDRRFIYVEMAFFSQWWQEQTEEMKNVVRELVSTGRLEFINGGWCMNDEAATLYADIIDQMTLGLNLLNETFGECGRPRIGWQIDPFGHSREQALIFSQLGFDGMFFGRLDRQDKRQRMDEKAMELVWFASNTLGAEGSLFTAINYNLYQAPAGFCFDVKLCMTEPIIDDPRSRDYNVHRRVDQFIQACQRRADVYATDNIMLTMGGDFTYQDANMWFKNMDKLIKYGNELQSNGSRFNFFYSTPSCYVQALNQENVTWPTKTDDFFPYGSTEHSYWTGYYTSRPTSKYMIRQGSNLLQSCKQMDSILGMNGVRNEGDVTVMKEAMAIMQHHDAVTGTEKQHVADDYARLLHIGYEECHKTQSSLYQFVLPKEAGATLPPVFHCQLNISQCHATEESSQFVVNVYNSLTRNIDKFVRVPIKEGFDFRVIDPDGGDVPIQVVPIPEFVLSIPGRNSSATMELVFQATQLPPLGVKSYHVQRTGPTRFNQKPINSKSSAPGEDYVISNENIIVTVDGTTRLMKSVTINGSETPLKQEFLYYIGHRGFIPVLDRSSGAYIFRPEGNEAHPLPMQRPDITVVQGELVQEIHQHYGLLASQVIRIYKGQDHIELDWVAGPIFIDDRRGKEIVTRVTTNLMNRGEFYTDSNGRQTLKRKVDFRESFNYTVTEPVAGNYYPINSHIYIKDDAGNQLTMLVDRAQGGSSLRDGELELMVHRRLLKDDWLGVGEPLNETAYGQGLVARGTHFLILSGSDDSIRLTRSLSQELYKQPQISFIPTDLPYTEWSAKFKTEHQLVSQTLPENVNLLTLEQRADGTFLIRLEHIYDVDEDGSLSQEVTVSLDDLFPGFTIAFAEETMLGGNQFKKDSNRLVWKVDDPMLLKAAKSCSLVTHDAISEFRSVLHVTLKPMEIRTYIVTLVEK